jgi:hypothetical protein
MKSSLKLAWGSALSYFLANLGMLILIAVLFVVIAIPVVIVMYAAVGANWVAFQLWMESFATANPWVIGGIGLAFLVPIVALFLVVVGSIYGMSKELVTTGETKAEHAFSYFKNKFFSFAGAGVLLTVIIILPMVALWGAVSLLNGYTVPLSYSAILSVITFVWAFFTVGLCANVFPAITYGASVIDAFKESFDLAMQRFDRVFGLLSAIIVLALITFGPMILWGLSLAPVMPPMTPALTPLAGVVITWTVVSFFLWVLLFLPMIIIAWVRSYADMTGKEIASPSAPEIPIV